jgi:hypothetical protein
VTRVTDGYGISAARRQTSAAAGGGDVSYDVLPRSTASLSRQGMALSHLLIGAAALAVPTK